MFVFKLVLGLVVVAVQLKVINTSGYPWLEQITRQEELTAGCDNLKHSTASFHFGQLDHILVDHKHKFLYCYVPKVACTNWKRVLMVLTDRSNATDLVSIPADIAHGNGTLIRLSDLREDRITEILEEYTSFIMVRHPFERLLSAYRNKLIGDTPSARYFQSRIGKYIVKKYRKNPSRQDLETGDNVTFREFARYLIAEGDVNATNEHWRSIDQLCHPCVLNYTFIGKYEKFEDDAKVILAMIDAPFLQFPQTRSSRTSDYLRSYYASLTLGEIRSLYKMYELDFRLFGYSLEGILGYEIG